MGIPIFYRAKKPVYGGLTRSLGMALVKRLEGLQNSRYQREYIAHQNTWPRIEICCSWISVKS